MKARFLITDHDPLILEEVRRFLGVRGYEVTAATNGLQCVDQLRETAPTILVLDPEMLWGGGEGVLDWLREEDPMLPPTVVVANGHGSCRLPDRFQPWIDARIERPGSLQDLVRYVNQLETLAWWTHTPHPEPATPLSLPSVFARR